MSSILLIRNLHDAFGEKIPRVASSDEACSEALLTPAL
jgi:hypothetical protein